MEATNAGTSRVFFGRWSLAVNNPDKVRDKKLAIVALSAAWEMQLAAITPVLKQGRPFIEDLQGLLAAIEELAGISR